MRRRMAWLLLGLMAFGLCGCTAAPTETTAPVQTQEIIMETQTEVTTSPEVETTAPVQMKNLFLKVSSITFSLVGESEDIYLGLIPREEVVWESEDPAVVSVENGILTAVGVGTTTIRASYEDRQVECTAGCLAQTQEELDNLDEEIISAPKRVIPTVDLSEPCSYFDNAAIVGDSITYFLLQWESKENQLGDLLFLCRGGVSINGFVQRYKNIYFRGRELNLEDAIGQSQVERVYFLLGSNDVGDDNNRALVFQNWATMLQRIREQHPTVEIVLQSNTPEYVENRHSRKKNDLIHQYNDQLREFARENGCLYLDLGSYYEDHYGRMPKSLNLDNYHMNEEGGMQWMQILRYYAQFEAEGGVLS